MITKTELKKWTVDECPSCGSDLEYHVSSYSENMGSVTCTSDDCYERLDLI